MYFFGGSYHRTQISRIDGCLLNRIGDLPFRMDEGGCANINNEKIILCFDFDKPVRLIYLIYILYSRPRFNFGMKHFDDVGNYTLSCKCITAVNRSMSHGNRPVRNIQSNARFYL